MKTTYVFEAFSYQGFWSTFEFDTLKKAVDEAKLITAFHKSEHKKRLARWNRIMRRWKCAKTQWQKKDIEFDMSWSCGGTPKAPPEFNLGISGLNKDGIEIFEVMKCSCTVVKK